MSCTPIFTDKRPLKKPKIGPPDIYPQEIKQKEDDLSAINVKQGFYEHFNNIDEYGSNKSLKILHDSLISSINGILKRKHDLNLPLDNSKKKLLLNIKDIFWPATARSKVSVDIWFKDLAANKPLNNLAKKVPIFNKKEELLMQLFETNVPLQRACWIIKLHAAHTSVIAENKIKKRQVVDPCYEWTQSLCKVIKELTLRLNILISKNTEVINEYSKHNLIDDSTNNDANNIIAMSKYINNNSTYTSMGFVAHIDSQQQQQVPNYMAMDLSGTFQLWKYIDSLTYYMFNEKLLENQEFLNFLCDLIEKPVESGDKCSNYNEVFDISFDFLLPLLLKYMDHMGQSYFFSRRLAYFSAQFLKKYQEMSLQNQFPLSNKLCELNHEDSKAHLTEFLTPYKTIQNYDKLLFFLKFHDCVKHRNIILNLCQIIQLITIKCPSALVWNGLWDWSLALKAQNMAQDNPKYFCQSPLDHLPFIPSELPIQHYSGNSIQIKKLLCRMEDDIAKRGIMAENLWSPPYEDKNKYFKTTNIINTVIDVLDALDHYDYNKCDKDNNMTCLYDRIYCLNEPYYQDKPFDVKIEWICRNEESILNTLCQWAITLHRIGTCRSIVVTRLLELRITALTNKLFENDELLSKEQPPETELTCQEDETTIDDKSIYYKTQARFAMQKLLTNFLDHYAPELNDYYDQSIEQFTNLIVLFGELIRAEVFKYDAYIKYLICRGDLDITNLQKPLWAQACSITTKNMILQSIYSKEETSDVKNFLSNAHFIYPFALINTLEPDIINKLDMAQQRSSNCPKNKLLTKLTCRHYQYLYYFPVFTDTDAESRLKILFGIADYKEVVKVSVKSFFGLLINPTSPSYNAGGKNNCTQHSIFDIPFKLSTTYNEKQYDDMVGKNETCSVIQKYLKSIFLTFPLTDQWMLSGKCLKSIVKKMAKFVEGYSQQPKPELSGKTILLPRIDTISFYYDLASCCSNYADVIRYATKTFALLVDLYRIIACQIRHHLAQVENLDCSKQINNTEEHASNEMASLALSEWQMYPVKITTILIGHLKLLQPYFITFSQTRTTTTTTPSSLTSTMSLYDGDNKEDNNDSVAHRLFTALLIFCKECGEIPQGACSPFRTIYSFIYDIYVACNLVRDTTHHPINKIIIEVALPLISEVKKSMYSIVAPTPPPPPSYHHHHSYHAPLLSGNTELPTTSPAWWDPSFLSKLINTWSGSYIHSPLRALFKTSTAETVGLVTCIDRELRSGTVGYINALESLPAKRYSFVCNALLALIRRLLIDSQILDCQIFEDHDGDKDEVKANLMQLCNKLPLDKYATLHYQTLKDFYVYINFCVEVSCQYQHPKFYRSTGKGDDNKMVTKTFQYSKSELTFFERLFTYQQEKYDKSLQMHSSVGLNSFLTNLTSLQTTTSSTNTRQVKSLPIPTTPLLNGEWLGAFKALCCPTHHMHHQHTLLQHPNPNNSNSCLDPHSYYSFYACQDKPEILNSLTAVFSMIGNNNFVTSSRNIVKIFSETGRLDKLMLFYDTLAILCISLILRHIFSLEDFIKHVALPSLLAAACPPNTSAATPPSSSRNTIYNDHATLSSSHGTSDNKYKITYNHPIQDKPAESGARLTCYLLYRLFKSLPTQTLFHSNLRNFSLPSVDLQTKRSSRQKYAHKEISRLVSNVKEPIMKAPHFVELYKFFASSNAPVGHLEDKLHGNKVDEVAASLQDDVDQDVDDDLKTAITSLGHMEEDILVVNNRTNRFNSVTGSGPLVNYECVDGIKKEEFKYLGYAAEGMSGDEQEDVAAAVVVDKSVKFTTTTTSCSRRLPYSVTCSTDMTFSALFEKYHLPTLLHHTEKQLVDGVNHKSKQTSNNYEDNSVPASFSSIFDEEHEKQNLMAHQHNISIGALLAVFKALILTSSLQGLNITNEESLDNDDPSTGPPLVKRRKGHKNRQHRSTYPKRNNIIVRSTFDSQQNGYTEYEETGEMISLPFNKFSQEILLVLTNQTWVKELFLKDPDGICSDQLLLDPLLSHKQASKLLHLICYPNGLPPMPKNFFFKDRSEIKSHVARIFCNLDHFHIRISYLELQLAIKQQVRDQDLNTLYDLIARVAVQIFQQKNQFTNDNVPIRYKKKNVVAFIYHALPPAVIRNIPNNNTEYSSTRSTSTRLESGFEVSLKLSSGTSEFGGILDTTSTVTTKPKNKGAGKKGLNLNNKMGAPTTNVTKKRKRGRPPLTGGMGKNKAVGHMLAIPSTSSSNDKKSNKKGKAASSYKHSPKPPGKATGSFNSTMGATIASPFNQSFLAEDFSSGLNEYYHQHHEEEDGEGGYNNNDSSSSSSSSSSLDSFPYLHSNQTSSYNAAMAGVDCDDQIDYVNQDSNPNRRTDDGILEDIHLTAVNNIARTNCSPQTPAPLGGSSIESNYNTDLTCKTDFSPHLKSASNNNIISSGGGNNGTSASLQSMLNKQHKREKWRKRKNSIWFVAPLVNKLCKAIQARILKYAGQILENGSQWATSGINKLEREKNTQRSASLLTHKPFLFLIQTCLARHTALFSKPFYRSLPMYYTDQLAQRKDPNYLANLAGECNLHSDQRLYLLTSLHVQITQSIKNANEDKHILLLPENKKARNDIRKNLTSKLALVGDMFDLIVVRAFSNNTNNSNANNLASQANLQSFYGLGGFNNSSSVLSGTGTPGISLGGLAFQGGPNNIGGGGDYYGISPSATFSSSSTNNQQQLALDWSSLLIQILTNDIIMNNTGSSFCDFPDTDVEKDCLIESSSSPGDTDEEDDSDETTHTNKFENLQKKKMVLKPKSTITTAYKPQPGFNAFIESVRSSSYYQHPNWDRGMDTFNYNESCARLFYTVFDMFTSIISASQLALNFTSQSPPTFVSTSSESIRDCNNQDPQSNIDIGNFVQLDDSQKKSYSTFCKKLKKEILEKFESSKGEPLKLLFPFARNIEKIIMFDQCLDKYNGNKFLGLKPIDSVNINPWEMIEGLPKSVGTGVINPSWWQIHKTSAFKPLTYYDNYSTLQLHTHHHPVPTDGATTSNIHPEDPEYASSGLWLDEGFESDFANPPEDIPDMSPPVPTANDSNATAVGTDILSPLQSIIMNQYAPSNLPAPQSMGEIELDEQLTPANFISPHSIKTPIVGISPFDRPMQPLKDHFKYAGSVNEEYQDSQRLLLQSTQHPNFKNNDERRLFDEYSGHQGNTPANINNPIKVIEHLPVISQNIDTSDILGAGSHLPVFNNAALSHNYNTGTLVQGRDEYESKLVNILDYNIAMRGNEMTNPSNMLSKMNTVINEGTSQAPNATKKPKQPRKKRAPKTTQTTTKATKSSAKQQTAAVAANNLNQTNLNNVQATGQQIDSSQALVTLSQFNTSKTTFGGHSNYLESRLPQHPNNINLITASSMSTSYNTNLNNLNSYNEQMRHLERDSRFTVITPDYGYQHPQHQQTQQQLGGSGVGKKKQLNVPATPVNIMTPHHPSHQMNNVPSATNPYNYDENPKMALSSMLRSKNASSTNTTEAFGSYQPLNPQQQLRFISLSGNLSNTGSSGMTPQNYNAMGLKHNTIIPNKSNQQLFTQTPYYGQNVSSQAFQINNRTTLNAIQIQQQQQQQQQRRAQQYLQSDANFASSVSSKFGSDTPAPSTSSNANKNIFDHFDFDNEEKINAQAPPSLQHQGPSRAIASNETKQSRKAGASSSNQISNQRTQNVRVPLPPQQQNQQQANVIAITSNTQYPLLYGRKPPPYSMASTGLQQHSVRPSDLQQIRLPQHGEAQDNSNNLINNPVQKSFGASNVIKNYGQSMQTPSSVYIHPQQHQQHQHNQMAQVQRFTLTPSSYPNQPLQPTWNMTPSKNNPLNHPYSQSQVNQNFVQNVNTNIAHQQQQLQQQHQQQQGYQGIPQPGSGTYGSTYMNPTTTNIPYSQINQYRNYLPPSVAINNPAVGTSGGGGGINNYDINPYQNQSSIMAHQLQQQQQQRFSINQQQQQQPFSNNPPLQGGGHNLSYQQQQQQHQDPTNYQRNSYNQNPSSSSSSNYYNQQAPPPNQ